MEKLIVEPDKIVNDFQDIKEIVNTVSQRMDEPDLKGKKVTTFVFSDREMLDFFNETASNPFFKTNQSNIDYQRVSAFNIENPLLPGLFYVVLKFNTIEYILPAYFHELGHIANTHFYKNENIPQVSAVVIDEALAELFCYWAQDEINTLSNLKYPESHVCVMEEVILQNLPEHRHKKPPEWKAAYELLFDLYKTYDSSRNIYHNLKNQTKDESQLLELCKKVEKDYLKP